MRTAIRLTAKDAKRMGLKGGHKYSAERIKIDGITFDSKKEAARYGELKILLAAKEIHGLEVHPRWPLTVNGQKIAKYEADFAYYPKPFTESKQVVEDVKSEMTRKLRPYVMKKKLMKAIWNIDIQEV